MTEGAAARGCSRFMHPLNVVAVLAVVLASSGAVLAGEPGSETLRSRYATFEAQHAAAGEAAPAIDIESRDDGEHVVGEIHALLPTSFETASAALKDPASWCEILLLHLDTKECRVTHGADGIVLQAGVVTHYDQPASSAYRVAFAYRLASDVAGYVQARLDADDGPVDTRDFLIVFEGLRARDGRMFAHMSYSYSYGGMSRLALQLYLLTFGRGKIGFTRVGTDPEGSPRYVGGMRGVVERNTMRYYLAVEAWLAASGEPTRSARIDRALRNWYAAIERYPRQLHELPEKRYLEMKRKEIGSYPN
jgi:hypothetical protein